jgi:hypothetical protein
MPGRVTVVRFRCFTCGKLFDTFEQAKGCEGQTDKQPYASKEDGVRWKESGFSGDDHLIFEAPVTELRWQVSVNRYGQPHARLFIMASGGGPQGMEADLPVLESDSDEKISAAARSWAESIIEAGDLMRRILMPSAEEEGA